MRDTVMRFTSLIVCKLLNNYFSDCFNVRVPPLSTSDHDLCYFSLSLCPEHFLKKEAEVYELLVGIDVTKSTGPDEITSGMIENAAYSITPPVTAIFNQSICESKFPTEWKKTRITPVPKSHDHSFVENFCPIFSIL